MDGSQFQRLDLSLTSFDITPCLQDIVDQWVKQYKPSANLPAGDVMSPDMQTVPMNVLRSAAKAIWDAGLGTLPTYVSGGVTITSVSGVAVAAYPWAD